MFRVTDRPEVHSNGYHVCFDVQSGPTGYILPHWIEDTWEIGTGLVISYKVEKGRLSLFITY